jgi:hypothetical protein
MSQVLGTPLNKEIWSQYECSSVIKLYFASGIYDKGDCTLYTMFLAMKAAVCMTTKKSFKFVAAYIQELVPHDVYVLLTDTPSWITSTALQVISHCCNQN